MNLLFRYLNSLPNNFIKFGKLTGRKLAGRKLIGGSRLTGGGGGGPPGFLNR